MSDFVFYLTTGLRHILDPKGYDHILFVTALCMGYEFKYWKQILWLVTSFTIGHSITLALAAFHVLLINRNLVEFLIPVTIIITCLINIARGPELFSQRKMLLRCAMAGVFGLIHGLGFSSLLLSLLGKEENILLPLLAFNIGLEAGQIFIVALVLTISYVTIYFTKIKLNESLPVLSGIIIGVALKILEANWIF